MTKIIGGTQKGDSTATWNIRTDGTSATEIRLGNMMDRARRDVSIDDSRSALAPVAAELNQLAKVMEREPASNHEETARIRRAQEEAESGNSDGMIEALKQVSKWALGASTTIGTALASAAIKNALGL